MNQQNEIESRLRLASQFAYRALLSVSATYIGVLSWYLLFYFVLINIEPKWKHETGLFSALFAAMPTVKLFMLVNILADDTPIRVDRMAGAPTFTRHIAYTSYHPKLGRWFWLCYVVTPFVFVVTFLTTLAIAISMGIYVLFMIFTAVNIVTALLCLSKESAAYKKGIDDNFRLNVISTPVLAERWATHSTAEHSKEAADLIKMRAALR